MAFRLIPPYGGILVYIEGYPVLNFEVASSNSFRDIPKQNHFLTAEAAADIDDSIKRKRFRVSL